MLWKWGVCERNGKKGEFEKAGAVFVGCEEETESKVSLKRRVLCLWGV